MSKKLARLTVDLSVSDHKKLKVMASFNGVSMKKFILMSIERSIRDNLKKMKKTMNKEEFDSLNQLTQLGKFFGKK